MAKQIKRSDIAEEDIFKAIRDSADKTIDKLGGINKEFEQLGKNIKDSLKASNFGNTSSINSFMEQTKQATQLTKEQLKVEQELQKAIKLKNTALEQEEKIKRSKLATEKETLRVMQEENKTEVSQIRLNTQKQKQLENELKQKLALEKAAQKELDTNSRLNGAYGRINKMLGNLRKEYRDLAIKKELGAQLTAKEELRYKTLGDRIVRFDTALKGVDASMGLHQRNVGNYASGWNGLGNSVNQLTRELPAFTNSIQTGFLAISNNIPALFDEIQKLKQANVELKASGEPTKSVLKQVAGSIFSLQTAMSIGITLLTIYGAKMVDFVVNALSPANKELERQERLNKAIAEQQKEKSKFLAEERAEFIGNINLLRKSNENSSERAKLIDNINEKYGLTLKNLKDEKQFQNQLNKEVGKYLQLKIEEFRQKQNEENIVKNLQKQDVLRAKLRKAEKEYQENQIKFDKQRQRIASGQSTLGEQGIEMFELHADRKLARNFKVVNDLNQELADAEKRLLSYDIDIKEVTDETNTGREKAVKTQKEINNEFKDTNDYLSREIELMQQLKQLEDERANQWTENIIQRELNQQLFNAENFFFADVEELERLLDVKSQMKIDQLKQDTEYEINEVKRKTKLEIQANREALKKERDELIKNGADKVKVEANYQEKKKALQLEEEKRYEDSRLEQKIITEKSAQQVLEIEKEKNEEIIKYNDQVHEALERKAKKTNEKTKEQIAEELQLRKDLMNQLNDLVKFSTEYFIDQSNRRIEQIDKELNALEKQQDFLEQMAVNGNITAEKSLAVNKKLQVEAQQEREKELKKQERIKLAQSVYDSYSSNVASGTQNPVTKTITDITLLNQFIKSLPTFYEGTETTVGQALGQPNMSGKDGYIVRVDGSEKVLNPELSRMTGNMTTKEIAQISEDRLKGRLIYKGEASQIGGAWESQLIVNGLNELKEVIKNKPETSIEASEIIGGVMHIIESRKERNTTVRNIRRIK